MLNKRCDYRFDSFRVCVSNEALAVSIRFGWWKADAWKAVDTSDTMRATRRVVSLNRTTEMPKPWGMNCPNEEGWTAQTYDCMFPFCSSFPFTLTRGMPNNGCEPQQDKWVEKQHEQQAESNAKPRMKNVWNPPWKHLWKFDEKVNGQPMNKSLRETFVFSTSVFHYVFH